MILERVWEELSADDLGSLIGRTPTRQAGDPDSNSIPEQADPPNIFLPANFNSQNSQTILDSVSKSRVLRHDVPLPLLIIESKRSWKREKKSDVRDCMHAWSSRETKSLVTVPYVCDYKAGPDGYLHGCLARRYAHLPLRRWRRQ